jgi:hypothetical protein
MRLLTASDWQPWAGDSSHQCWIVVTWIRWRASGRRTLCGLWSSSLDEESGDLQQPLVP